MTDAKSYSKQWGKKILLALIALSMMTFFGMETLFRPAATSRIIASSGSHSVTFQDFMHRVRWDFVHNRAPQGQTVQEYMQWGHSLVKTLLQEKILDDMMEKENLWISNKKVFDYVRTLPFLHNAQGKFNFQVWQTFLRRLGMNDTQYIRHLRQAMIRDQWMKAVKSLIFVPTSLQNILGQGVQQKRSGYVYRVTPSRVTDPAHAFNEQDLRQFYKNNPIKTQASQTYQLMWMEGVPLKDRENLEDQWAEEGASFSETQVPTLKQGTLSSCFITVVGKDFRFSDNTPVELKNFLEKNIDILRQEDNQAFQWVSTSSDKGFLWRLSHHAVEQVMPFEKVKSLVESWYKAWVHHKSLKEAVDRCVDIKKCSVPMTKEALRDITYAQARGYERLLFDIPLGKKGVWEELHPPLYYEDKGTVKEWKAADYAYILLETHAVEPLHTLQSKEKKDFSQAYIFDLWIEAYVASRMALASTTISFNILEEWAKTMVKSQTAAV